MLAGAGTAAATVELAASEGRNSGHLLRAELQREEYAKFEAIAYQNNLQPGTKEWALFFDAAGMKKRLDL